MDKNQFVGIRVLIEIIGYGFFWRGQHNGTIAIGQNGFAAFEKIVFWFYLKTPEFIRLDMICFSYFRLYRVLIFNVLDLGWALLVITISAHPIKTDGTKKLFIIQTAIFLSELGVAFWGYVS